MKVSYSVLQNYVPNIKSPEAVAEDLIMHTAEVEEIISTYEHLETVVCGKITEYTKHPNADTLGICQVDTGKDVRQIICGAPNARVGIQVWIALPGTELKPGFVIQKSKIRGETSNGMLCSEDEIGLTDIRQEGIMELPDDIALGTNAKEYYNLGDTLLEIDNKAINHRPDLFSHIGIAREIAAIAGESFDYSLSKRDFSHLPRFTIKNDIPEVVKRYIGLKADGVSNIKSPEYIMKVLESHNIESKGVLVDITNYSLYLYGQPAHCFDSSKITGDIHIRFAKDGEHFEALNGKSYTLRETDIVIADKVSVLALGGIIGGKASAVSDKTTSITIESAWFDQAILRATGKRLGIRTDALNVFEKDLVVDLRDSGMALIVSKLEKHFPNLELTGFEDVYPVKEPELTIEYHHDFVCNLIGKSYEEAYVMELLSRVGIKSNNNTLEIPLWRKDIEHIADIAEEVARLDGYNSVSSTVPRIQLGAVKQHPLYIVKRKIRNYLPSIGFFELYTYSFVNEHLMSKALLDMQDAIAMKNPLSEELSHLRPSLIPNLLQAISENRREFSDLRVFEYEKVFEKNKDNTVNEQYELSMLISTKDDNAFYPVMQYLEKLMFELGVQKYKTQSSNTTPAYAHAGRTAEVIIRGKSIGFIGEIHPKALKNFDISERIGFISIRLEDISEALFTLIEAKDVSQFQENNFDINFVVDRETSGKTIQETILGTDTIIQKVELFDIYENEEKLPGKRSLSFTVFIQSDTETLDDTVKNDLIKRIVANVEKKGGSLR